VIAYIRNRLAAIVCFFLGHQCVKPEVLWEMLKIAVSRDADAICLRCRKQYFFTKALTDSVFASSPLLQRLRERESTINKEGN